MSSEMTYTVSGGALNSTQSNLWLFMSRFQRVTELQEDESIIAVTLLLYNYLCLLLMSLKANYVIAIMFNILLCYEYVFINQ